jgi:hypothetical protein
MATREPIQSAKRLIKANMADAAPEPAVVPRGLMMANRQKIIEMISTT